MVYNSDFFIADDPESSQGIDSELPTRKGELHLRFYLPSGDEFALPATGIREVMQQEVDRITAIPNASPLLLGTINLRGQVIWVADLGQFLGDSAVLNTERAEIPVIAVEDQETLLGLAIDRLGSMEWLDDEQLQMPLFVADNIAPYVQGEWVLNQEENQFLRLLDYGAILRSARWA
ncbi:MAG: chemotaxis protein CheW [Gomphosphaeria aponina SAG 52.96 = DSM 107014]|uniref:Chemotaxis protein CheW n=1 Tax=Gomphosphaeria aponina SAG 52.96 = DSM 107014 TaxID=1521640 RepID=A0A941GXM3_9CHRO|nr:chemotaxis protein CheW [Gomphosphaeria aponina SAG 52.96 = DSM 107014]